MIRVATPTETESVLPWKRGDESETSGPLQQNEFPAWVSNREYLAYNSPSSTFLGTFLLDIFKAILKTYVTVFFFL